MSADAGLGPPFASYLRSGDVTAARAGFDADADRPPSELAGGAHLALLAGDFASAGVLAERALRTSTGPSAERATSIAGAVVAALAALRGDQAFAGFATSLEQAEHAGDRWSQAVVQVWWAEQLSFVDPGAAAQRAEQAAHLAEQIGDETVLHWADRNRALAALVADDSTAALELAARLRAAAPTATESARADVIIGRSELAGGRAEAAAEALHRAADALAAAGATFELVATLLWLSVADDDRAPTHLERARAISDGLGADPAWDLLWSRRPSLALRVLGTQAITVGATVVRCKTSHAEKLIFSLALAGTPGLDADELCERLWPEKDHDKAVSSLSTATWDARVALGTEAWRLVRTDDRFHLTMDGVRIDLDELEDRIARDADDDAAWEQLRAPVLPAWRHEDWVIDLDERRAALVARHDR